MFWRSRLDFEGLSVRVVALVVGTRRASEKQLKNSNNEPMNPTKSGILEAEVVAAGPEASGAGPKAVSFPTRTTAKRVEMGKGGCEIGKRRSFSHLETAFSHINRRKWLISRVWRW